MSNGYGGIASAVAVSEIFEYFPELNHLPLDTKFKIFRERSYAKRVEVVSIMWNENGKRKRIDADLVEIDAWGRPVFENVRYVDY